MGRVVMRAGMARGLGAAVAFAVLLLAPAAQAETMFGRTVTVTDGRADTARAAPLVLALHGVLGTPRSMRRKTDFDRLAEAHGFVAAYPEGLDRRWNDGRRTDAGGRTDDVAFLSAVIGQFVADGRADASRVFIAGHSNGGGMAMRMACDRPDLIAGIAVAATNVQTRYQCADGAAVPVIFFHGTADPISPPEGRPGNSRLGGALSSEETLALWRSRNGCRGQPAVQVYDRRDDGTRAEVLQYTRCRAPLVYVRIIGHGHGWPGAAPRRRGAQGPATQEVDAAVLSWWFFADFAGG